MASDQTQDASVSALAADQIQTIVVAVANSEDQFSLLTKEPTTTTTGNEEEYLDPTVLGGGKRLRLTIQKTKSP